MKPFGPVYLRFLTQRWSLESRLIRFGTRWWPSHVEFVHQLPSGTWTTLGSRVDGGVMFRSPDYCRPSREEWWTAPGIEDAYHQAITVVGAKYDRKDILGFIFSRDWHTEGHFICSELVDWSFKKINQPLTNTWMPSHRVSPRDLMVSPNVNFFRSVIQ